MYRIFPLLLTASTLLINAVAAQQSPHVLILHSYHPQYIWTDQLTAGATDKFIGVIPHENLHVKYLNARRFSDDRKSETLKLANIAYEFTRFRPDVIVAFDDAAYYLLLNNPDGIFDGIPIVFGGVNNFNQTRHNLRKGMTGIVEGDAIKQNIELIVQAQPKVRQIVLLGDGTGTGLNLLTKAKTTVTEFRAQNRFSDIKFIFKNAYNLTQLRNEFANTMPNTAILVLAVHQKSNGDYFAYDQEIPQLSDQLNVPIYGMWGALLLGNGAVGGYMNDPYLHGANVAAKALQVLNGTSTNDIPLTLNSVFLPKFDYQQLTRFDIEPRRLPINAQLKFKPKSYLERHKTELQIFGIVLAIMIVVITLLSINLKRRIKHQNELKRFNKELEFRVEERTNALRKSNEELQRSAAKLEQFAYEDSLTHLGNRRAATEQLNSIMQRISHDNGRFCIALIDIDFFKKINDSYGHDKGDQVLQQSAKVMKSALRPTDSIFRWGGEEFLATFPCATCEQAVAICERLRHNIAKHNYAIAHVVTASIGLAQLSKTDSLDSLISRADKQLYLAKNNGRNQLQFAD